MSLSSNCVGRYDHGEALLSVGQRWPLEAFEHVTRFPEKYRVKCALFWSGEAWVTTKVGRAVGAPVFRSSQVLPPLSDSMTLEPEVASTTFGSSGDMAMECGLWQSGPGPPLQFAPPLTE